MSADVNKKNAYIMNRRSALALGLGGVGTCALVGLTGCSPTAEQPAPANDSASQEEKAVEINAKAFDDLIAGGPIADGAAIAASTWASAIQSANVLRLGSTKTSTLFSLLDVNDNHLRGFDAGLAQMLARYITGDQSKISFTQVTSDTRESVLQNNQVDTVIATYSITPDRQKLVGFAGPYYTTQQAILVLNDNNDIKGLDDLADKNVAAQSGSTGPKILEELVPKAKIQEFTTDEEARSALAQHRVDAYVIDMNMHLGSMVKNPGRYKIVGEPFGPVDPYGIGLPLHADAVDFVNEFLTRIEDTGLWKELWKICIGDRTGVKDIPQPPKIGV